MQKMDEDYCENELVIYIIGGFPHEKHSTKMSNHGEIKSTTPEFVDGFDIDDIAKIILYFQSILNIEIKIHLVDKSFGIRYYYTPEGKKYFNKLHDFKENEEFSNVTFHDCSWDTILEDGISIDLQNIYYIVTNDTDFENNYDFYNFIGLKIYDNVYVKYGLTDILDLKTATVPFNVFGNNNDYQTILGERPSENKKSIKWIIENGVSTYKNFVKCGFLKRERFVQQSVPTWVLNVESHFTKGIILEYELLPPRKIIFTAKLCIGKTIQEKFIESADYRYEITDHIAKVLTNLGLKYGLIREVTDYTKINFDILLGDIDDSYFDDDFA